MKNKKNLIWIALVAILLVVILLIVFGKKDDTTPSIGNDVATPTLSLEITKIPHSILTSTPNPTKGVDEDEEIDIPFAPTSSPSDDKNDNEDKPNKDDAIDFPNDDVEPTKAPSLVTPRPNVTLVPTPTTKVEPTPTTKVEPTKAPTPSVAPTSTPKVEPTKAPISSGDTIKLGAIGVDIPLRDSFNHEALEDSKTKTWYGDVDDTKSGQALLDKLDEIRDTLIENHVIASGDQAFLYTDNVITFDFFMKGANSNFELHRDTTNGEYVLEINSPLDYYYYKHYDVDWAPYGRDIVLHFCSLISSTPNEVFAYLYEGIVNDSTIITSRSYTPVGDCAIKYDIENSRIYDNGGYHLIFQIKPND